MTSNMKKTITSASKDLSERNCSLKASNSEAIEKENVDPKQGKVWPSLRRCTIFGERHDNRGENSSIAEIEGPRAPVVLQQHLCTERSQQNCPTTTVLENPSLSQWPQNVARPQSLNGIICSRGDESNSETGTDEVQLFSDDTECSSEERLEGETSAEEGSNMFQLLQSNFGPAMA